MLISILNGVRIKPAAPFAFPPALFAGAGAFVCGPVAGQPPALPSVMGGGAYVQLQVTPASMAWDAMTVGYGGLGEMALLTAGNAAAAHRVRQFAASRARLLRTIYAWPVGPVPGPQLRPEYAYVESSERRVVSFLIGQTVAQTQAKKIWNVQRLFHRSLYAPFLPLLAPGIAALPPGQSPDYLCLAPAPPGGPVPGFGLIEAKGTNSPFNPQANAKHRDKLNSAFLQLGAIPGAWQIAVSVACLDAALPADVVVGQFWDPPNPNAQPVPLAVAAALTAEYFRRISAFLGCIEPPMEDEQGATVWYARSIGFRIAMSVRQWGLLAQLSQRQITDQDFYIEILQLLPSQVIAGADPGTTNGDGLDLQLIDFR